MAFDYTNLYPDSSGNGGFTKSWNYTTLDPLLVVKAANYFNIVASRLGIGDNIFVSVVDHFEPRTRTSLYEQAELFVIGIAGGVVTVAQYSVDLDSQGRLPAVDGSLLLNLPGGSPHAPTTSVQFNDAGSFGGQANFTFIKGTGLVSLPSLEVQTGNIDSPDGVGATDIGVPLSLTAGNGGVTSGAGGAVGMQGGSADGGGAGGEVNLHSGDAAATGAGGNLVAVAGDADDIGRGGNVTCAAGTGGGTSGDGGNLAFTSGDALGIGDSGFIHLISGTAHGTGAGGPVVIDAGDASNGNGGAVTIDGGAGGTNGNGGNITLIPGLKAGVGVDGHIKIDTLGNFADDVAAAAGGVPVLGLYRTASAVKVRVT